VNKVLTRVFAQTGNILVIIGLALVVVELQQNRAMMRAQIRNELGQKVIDIMSLAGGDREYVELMVRAGAGGEVTPAERVMLDLRAEAVVRYWENVHYQHREGLYDDTEFSKHLATMREVLLNRDKYLASYWCANKQFFSDPFRIELDASLPANLCPAYVSSSSSG
jgi:hypothetical protein